MREGGETTSPGWNSGNKCQEMIQKGSPLLGKEGIKTDVRKKKAKHAAARQEKIPDAGPERGGKGSEKKKRSS